VTPEAAAAAMLAAALGYAARGWPVLPVAPGRKRPILTAWQRLATADPATLARWWRDTPDAQIGLLCGRAFDVLDIEAPALAALAAWMQSGGHVLPECPRVRSGRGGLHAYLAPSGGPVRELWLGDLRLGELRGIGGQVLAPPSETSREPSGGGPYRWIRPPDDAPLPPAPPWLAQLIKPVPVIPARPARIVVTASGAVRLLELLAGDVAGAPEGTRNRTLFSKACKALESGIPAEAAESILYRTAVAAGLDRREVQRTLRSAHDRVTAKGGRA
jgi:hypothetical protein